MATAQLEAKEAKDLMQQEVFDKEKLLEDNARLSAQAGEVEETIAKLEAKFNTTVMQLDEMQSSYDIINEKYESLKAQHEKPKGEAAQPWRNVSDRTLSSSLSPRHESLEKQVLVTPATSAPLQARLSPNSVVVKSPVRNAKVLERTRIAPARSSSPMQTSGIFTTYANLSEHESPVTNAKILEGARIAPARGSSPMQTSGVFTTYANVSEPGSDSRYQLSSNGSFAAPLGTFAAPLGSLSTPLGSLSTPLGNSASLYGPREPVRPTSSTKAVAPFASPKLLAGPPRTLKLGSKRKPY